MAPPFKGFNFNFKRINWPLLLVHSLATACFVLGGQFWLWMWWEAERQGVHTMGVEQMNSIEKFMLIVMLFGGGLGFVFAWFLAILMGCLLSGVVVRRREESAAIPLLVFIVVLLFSATMVYSLALHQAFWERVYRLVPHESRYILGVVGGLLVVLGLVFMLLTWNRARFALTPKANK